MKFVPMIFLCVLAATCAACDSALDVGSEGEAESPPTQGGDGAGLPGIGNSTGKLEPRAVCDRLLSCASTKRPSQYGDFFPLYGANGSCWRDEGEAACASGCRAALEDLHSSKFGSSCNFCESSAECGKTYSHQNVCDPERNTCEACLTNADCQDYVDRGLNRGICSPGKECVGCLSDADCDPAPEGATYRVVCISQSCQVYY